MRLPTDPLGRVRRMCAARAGVVDAVVGAGLTIGALWSVTALTSDRTVAGSAAAAAVCTSSVAWRRHRPVAAALTAWTALAAYQVSSHDSTGAFVTVAVVLTGYLAGRCGGRRSVAVVAAVALAATTAIELDAGFSLAGDLATWVMAALAPLAAGRLVTHWVATVDRLGAVSAQLAVERETQRVRAVTAERLRMARDLHDVVAHGVSAMVIQAGAARMVITTDSPDSDAPADIPAAGEALRAVSSAGRAALVDLRRIIGVRRSASTALPSAPSPATDLGHLDRIIEHARATGITVTTRIDPDVTLPAAAALTVVRVVQEALTNVARHAPGAAVRIELASTDDEAHVCVVNSAAAGPASRLADSGSGVGLIGMRERVALHGGRLRAGPLPDGGFAIRAWLPTHDSRPAPVAVAASGSTATDPARNTRVSRRRPGVWVDVGVAGAWLVALEVEALFSTDLGLPHEAAAVLVAAMAAAAIGRRRAPLMFLVVVGALAVIAVAIATAHPDQGDPVGTFTVVVGTYTVAAHATRLRSIIGLLIMFAGIALVTLLSGHPAGHAIGASLTACIVWILGRLVRQQRRRSARLQAATAQLAAEQDRTRVLAIEAERARIAADLHELVASLVTNMIVRADLAARVLPLDVAGTVEHLLAIESGGRQALTQMRHILGVLRHGHAAAPRHPPDPAEADPGDHPLVAATAP